MALCFKAKQDRRLEQIQGVYALCPYIYGAWAQKNTELPSLVENNGYLIDVRAMEVLASIYDPEHKHATNPLCWPYWATPDDLYGLPPHVISVNELDPLRDEGLRYYQKLVAGLWCNSQNEDNGVSTNILLKQPAQTPKSAEYMHGECG